VADRTRFLLTYDIREPKRLRRVHKVAQDFGTPLQYSVFVCDLTGIELVDLKRALLRAVKTDEDSVSIFDLGPPKSRGLTCVEFIGTRRPLPDDGATVW
jgi:CRISPR-associated protein Cas2